MLSFTYIGRGREKNSKVVHLACHILRETLISLTLYLCFFASYVNYAIVYVFMSVCLSAELYGRPLFRMYVSVILYACTEAHKHSYCSFVVRWIKKAVADVAPMELFCFLYHHNDNGYAYTFVGGCIGQLLILFKLL